MGRLNESPVHHDWISGSGRIPGHLDGGGGRKRFGGPRQYGRCTQGLRPWRGASWRAGDFGRVDLPVIPVVGKGQGLFRRGLEAFWGAPGGRLSKDLGWNGVYSASEGANV